MTIMIKHVMIAMGYWNMMREPATADKSKLLMTLSSSQRYGAWIFPCSSLKTPSASKEKLTMILIVVTTVSWRS